MFKIDDIGDINIITWGDINEISNKSNDINYICI